ncbi:hypothetical protein F2Q68_00018785 [Brassica cretica]|uniref:Uncharacterized protein n=2 Tax=Brassica cretica TaxID=69181 RepID=A0A8S9G378_BRACR|nr:hypothetical protein F2Q68_00018785 [Brassica cretica]
MLIRTFKENVFKYACEDGGEEASSQATTNGDHPTKRPPGVKAAKGVGGKRTKVDELGVSEFKGMWSIKENDLAAEERLKKMGLLERLISKKKEPLTQFEEALKKKLITEMLGNYLLVRNALSLKLSCAGDNETMRERENETNDTDKSSHECEDGGEEASSQATTNGDHPTKRPPGVKVAKGVGGNRTKVDELGVSEFKGMWSIKEKDLAAEERLKKMGLLESLISKKKEPLTQFEEALKEKLITEMLGN